MKEYFYLLGKEQKGPFSIEELKTKNLTSETLVWSDGMENWIKVKELPELAEDLKPKSVPPPPPTENTSHGIKYLRWLIIWSSIHLFALITSYSRIKIFADYRPETKNFWPFVKFTNCYNPWGYGQERCDFKGVFVYYDWSEFAVYVGGALVIFLLVKISSKNEQTTS